jgi:exodeoxyribonuclease VII large subunit
MEMNRELPFPRVPQRIAVISSETAAGYGDFLDTIQNNSQGFYLETNLFTAVMQGEEAPVSIIGALDRIHEAGTGFDCVAIIRGGGARADLECYNDYELAYYITQFPLPVITGIGHERDESVADMVAAYGLKTPTAVAEFLVDHLLSFEFHLSSLYDRLAGTVKRIAREHLARLERLRGNMEHLSKGTLKRQEEGLGQLEAILIRAVSSNLTRTRDRLTLLEKRTELVDPENVLRRGYSITMLEGKALTDSKMGKPGDLLSTRLHRGVITSRIEKNKE